MSVPLEPESSAICTMTHLTIISRHFEAVFGNAPPQPLPGIPDLLLLLLHWHSSACLLEWIWRMKIGQSSSNIPTPPPSPSIITFFNHPHNHLSQRFSLGTRGWSICFLGPCFHPPPPISPSGHSQPLLLPLSATHTLLYYGDKDTPMQTPSLLLHVWLKNENLHYVSSGLFVQLTHMVFLSMSNLTYTFVLTLCLHVFIYAGQMQDEPDLNPD